MLPIKVLIPDLPQYAQEESEFCKRELGLVAERIRVDSRDPLPLGSLLFCYRIEDWKERLSAMPAKSVVVILAANEYYEIRRWENLNNFESIYAALIEYFPVRFTFTQGLLSIRWIFENPRDLLNRVFWGETKRALFSWLALRSLELKMPVFSLPVGYTNKFVNELNVLNLLDSNTDSLFSNIRFDSLNPRHEMSFFGQKGSYSRRKMISFFANSTQIEISQYDTYGGFTDDSCSTAYAESMLKSKFVLCPPGNKSNCTHRYIESLLLGAIPIITESTIQDWTSHDFYPRELQYLNKSYKKLWTVLSKKSEAEITWFLGRIREHSRRKCDEARKRIEIWCSESARAR